MALPESSRSLVYVANIRLPTEQAHGYQIMKMCEAFARRGIRVRLVVPHRKNAITLDPFSFYSIDPIFQIIRLPVIDFSYSPFFSFFPLSVISYLLVSTSFFFHLFPFARAHIASHEAVYTRSTDIAWFFSRYFRTGYEVHSVSRLARIWIGPWKAPAALFFTTRGMMDFFVRRGVSPTSAFVAPDGFDPKDFADLPSRGDARRLLSLPPNRKIICYAGRFTTFGNPKGVEGLLAAAKLITYRDTLIILVGAMHHEVRRFAPSPSVLVIPFVKRAIALRYLVAADILVMPFPSGSAHYRHAMSPLKMFEYMASGTPIVATDLPSVREILSDRSAFLCPADRPLDLARALDAALSNPRGAASRARAARRDVEAYSWDLRASAIVDTLFPSP